MIRVLDVLENGLEHILDGLWVIFRQTQKSMPGQRDAEKSGSGCLIDFFRRDVPFFFQVSKVFLSSFFWGLL